LAPRCQAIDLAQLAASRRARLSQRDQASSSLMRELAGDQPLPSMEQATEAFDVHGLVIPSGNILI
jgi:hypothetical protein